MSRYLVRATDGQAYQSLKTAFSSAGISPLIEDEGLLTMGGEMTDVQAQDLAQAGFEIFQDVQFTTCAP